MKRKTPQEKKALSYAKDCRNTYGESDKGSRKSIRRHKTFPTRIYRSNVNDLLRSAVGAVDLEEVEAVESKIKEIKRKKWKKYPDKSLGEIVRQKLEWGQRGIRRKFKGTMKNVSRKESPEYILTENGWREKR